MGLLDHADFTLDKYRQLLAAICESGYKVLTVADGLDNHNSEQKVVLLRHDVDRKTQRALIMARLEHELGIKSTYYFRFNKKTFQPRLIMEIAEMGHEVGYHYETLDKAKGDYVKAIQMFEDELAEFRKITEVKTVCMHGNPLTRWDNRTLWNKYDFRDFGLVGEAYLSVDSLIYLSDTGRTWADKYKVKDWLPSADSNDNQDISKAIIASTDDIIELIKKGQLGHAYLLVHPERWSHSLIGWMADSARDAAVNLGKRILALKKGGTTLQGKASRNTLGKWEDKI